MRLTDLCEEFLDLLENRPVDRYPSAGVVGDISRTWYDDRDLLIDLFELIQEHDSEFHIALHGAHGFDTSARDAAVCAGVEAISYGNDAPWEERFGYKTNRELTAAAWMLIVLPRRKQKGALFERCYDVDPAVFESALELGVPIFALMEDGQVKAVK